MKLKTFGFFDFHVTADKTRDYLINNMFGPDDVKIMKIDKGQKFNDSLSAEHNRAAVADSDTEPQQEDHSSIISFFRHLFKMDGKHHEVIMPLVADRSGFIISVITPSEEKAELAKEILHHHGASYIKILDEM